jgi:hypothetical protein
MNSAEQKIIRAAPATVIIFSILCLPLLFAGLVTLFKSTDQPLTGLLLCALYPSVVYWICSPTVILDQDALTYRALFTRRTIDLSSVTQATVAARPAPTLELRATNSTARASLAFSIKPFTKNGVACMMQHIRTSCPNARFDAISDDLLRADFGSVTRETLSTRNLIRSAVTVGGASLAYAIFRVIQH